MQRRRKSGGSLPESALFFAVKPGIKGIEIFTVHFIGQQAQRLAEALIVNNFALAQKLDRLDNIGIIHQAQNIIISDSGLLLWGDFVRTTLHNII